MGRRSRERALRRESASSTARPEDVARDFLRRAGATDPSRDHDRYWTRLEARHGGDAVAFDESLGRGGEGIWDLKNASLGMSLDITMWDVGGVLRSQLQMLAERGAIFESAQRVVDVGCDNGLITAFVASLTPHGTVRGIDLSEAAIERSRELASRLRISNAQFAAADFREWREEDAADVVLASRLLTSGDGWAPATDCFAIDEVQKPNKRDPLVADLRKLKSLGSENAQFVLVERISPQHRCLRFAWAMAEAGLFIDWERSGFATGREGGSDGTQPMLVASAVGEPTTAEDVLVFWARGTRLFDPTPDLRAEEIVEICLRGERPPGPPGGDAAAELQLLSRVRTADWVAGAEVLYADTTARFELLQEDDEMIIWMTTGSGTRIGYARPASELADAEIALSAVPFLHEDGSVLTTRPEAGRW